MDRRDFLKMATMAGLVVGTPLVARRARAQTAQPYGGPYFVMVNAAGGWDPIYMCDPKLTEEVNRVYTEVKQVGNISYAPLAADTASLGLDVTYRETYDRYLFSNEEFFTKHHQRLMVLNGVDTSTNSHSTGSRVTWSGRTEEGHPCFAALCAAVRAADKPLGFLSSGGFDATADVVPLTRITDVSSIQRITFPNRLSAGDEDSATYHSPSALTRIQLAQRERNQRQLDAQKLPSLRRAIGSLFAARTGDNELKRLQLPTSLVDLPGNQLNDMERVLRQAQIGMAAFKAGLAASANLSLGGFDTHGNHDTNGRRQLAKLLGIIDYVWEEAARLGIGDKVVIVAGSDFGRGPHYNGTSTSSGKDHWSITSMLLMGPGIPGNKVIGHTDPRHRPGTINIQSLQPDDGGIRLNPGHVHKALRTLAGISGTDLDRRFPLAGPDLKLFG